MSTHRGHAAERLDQVSGRPRRADEAARIRDLLRVEIVFGRYGVRSLLPGERELGLEYAVGRNVIRDALAMLRDEGLVERIQGFGTFVQLSKAQHRFDRMHAITDSAHRVGLVSGEVLSTCTITAPRPVAEGLGLEPGAPCTLIEYTAAVGDSLFSLSTSYLPLHVGSAMDPAAFAGDFYDLLESAGFDVAAGDLAVEAVAADSRTAAILHVPLASPVMLFHRRLRGPDGTVLEFGFVRCRGDRLSLQIKLPRSVQGGTQ